MLVRRGLSAPPPADAVAIELLRSLVRVDCALPGVCAAECAQGKRWRDEVRTAEATRAWYFSITIHWSF